MTDRENIPQQAKIYLARDDRKSSKISDTIVAALIGGLVAGVGMYLQNNRAISSDQTTIERIQTERTNALDAIESAKVQAETQLSFDVRSHILSFSEGVFSSSGTYEGQISAVMRAFALDGVDGALDVHTAFRNGATIRALEQISFGEIKPEERTSIAEVLGRIPRVLFLESRLDSNIYCEDLEGTGRTNIDAFAPQVRDLPIRMAVRSFGPGEDEGDQIDRILDMIGSEQPDLIVAHLSTFETKSGDNRETILQDMFQSSFDIEQDYFPSVILYSRLPPGQTEGKVEFPSREDLLGTGNSDRSFYATIAMVGHDSGDPDCFAEGSENSRLLRAQVTSAISHQDLYSRNFSE